MNLSKLNTKIHKYMRELATTFDTVTVDMLKEHSVTGYNGMRILDYETLATEVFGNGNGMWNNSYYVEGSPAYKLFDHLSYNMGVAYYARPRESFDNLQGQKDAQRMGATFIILEDMS